MSDRDTSRLWAQGALGRAPRHPLWRKALAIILTTAAGLTIASGPVALPAVTAAHAATPALASGPHTSLCSGLPIPC